MNKSSVVNVLLAIALVILSVKITLFDHPTDATPSDPSKAVLENIATRTSIRTYQNKPVEETKIDAILRAAMAAPSARNMQPWEFVVVKDTTILRTLAGQFKPYRSSATAPMAIVVCGDTDNTFEGDGREFWVQDTSAATENILLAAHSLGLGAVWCGIYPLQERVETLREVLHLPANITPMSLVTIGYADEDPAPKDKWKPERIHYNFW